MYSPWTVFYNLTIAALLGAAGYIGAGESSVYSRYQAENPVAEPTAIAPAVIATLQRNSYVAPAAQRGPILLASYTSASTAIDPMAEPTVTIASPAATLTATVTGEQVNLRLGPSTDFDKIGSVVLGDELVLTGKTDGSWVQVQHPVDGSPVWIAAKFIN